jgi:hypothetical protein
MTKVTMKDMAALGGCLDTKREYVWERRGGPLSEIDDEPDVKAAIDALARIEKQRKIINRLYARGYGNVIKDLK